MRRKQRNITFSTILILFILLLSKSIILSSIIGENLSLRVLVLSTSIDVLFIILFTKLIGDL